MKSRELEITIAMRNPHKAGERVKQVFSLNKTISNYDYIKSEHIGHLLMDIIEDMLERTDAVSKAELVEGE